ncbi:MAG: AAA family ATPase [Cyclobacteriaceae bacterium]
MISRSAIGELLNWKARVGHKPLIIRGARQVGKTTLIDQFAKYYDQYIYLNLERTKDSRFFEDDRLDTALQALLLDKGVSISRGSTLLFIDEIQQVPKVIGWLRYINEDYPDLDLIAAGSLLEHALAEVPSFPVGRVEYLSLGPLEFEEYLGAKGEEQALQLLRTLPIADYAHEKLLRLFNEFSIVGGMPDIVARFANHQDYGQLQPYYSGLIKSYSDDVVKYARNATEQKIIRHIIRTAPKVADQRIVFQNFGGSNYRSREVGEAMHALQQARIIQLIYPTTEASVPAMEDIKKAPRLQYLDTGLLNYALGIQKELIGLQDLNGIYRGKVIQHMVTQQLMSIHYDPLFQPMFWVRQKSGAQSELDLVLLHGQYLMPIEVKSGPFGKLRSLHQFMEVADHHYAIRLYAGKLHVQNVKTPAGRSFILLNLPYYLITRIREYIDWFVAEY